MMDSEISKMMVIAGPLFFVVVAMILDRFLVSGKWVNKYIFEIKPEKDYQVTGACLALFGAFLLLYFNLIEKYQYIMLVTIIIFGYILFRMLRNKPGYDDKRD